MPNLTRRGFMAASLAACTARALPPIVAKAGTRRILTLTYDKALGIMRAVERVVP